MKKSNYTFTVIMIAALILCLAITSTAICEEYGIGTAASRTVVKEETIIPYATEHITDTTLAPGSGTRVIQEGKNAQITKDFMIISRCESLIAGKPVDDALERCHAYVAAGADGVMIHSKNKDGMDIKEFCQRFREKDAHTPTLAVRPLFSGV